jgi:hypothetical protein
MLKPQPLVQLVELVMDSAASRQEEGETMPGGLPDEVTTEDWEKREDLRNQYPNQLEMELHRAIEEIDLKPIPKEPLKIRSWATLALLSVINGVQL